MTDQYEDLIRRLQSEANDTKDILGFNSGLLTKAVTVIKELVEERDKWKKATKAWQDRWSDAEGKADKALMARDKAEADLAAARAALRYFVDSLSEFHGGEHHDDECPDCRAMVEHARAIAAARAEGCE